MTKKQMIGTLRGMSFGTVIGSKGDEALRMDIAELEQEPCTDAVSRQAVLEMAYDMSEIDGEHFTEPHMIVDVEDIQKLPSVTQKYGKWIGHPEIETSAPEYLMFYECSECGDKPCFCKSDIHKKRFCSNCGCHMVEPQESEDKERIKAIPSAEPNMTWVTGADGAKIAFKDVPVWKVTKICEILGEPQESEGQG